jgi:hypothetical protein
MNDDWRKRVGGGGGVKIGDEVERKFVKNVGIFAVKECEENGLSHIFLLSIDGWEFIHGGKLWSIKRELNEECVISINIFFIYRNFDRGIFTREERNDIKNK